MCNRNLSHAQTASDRILEAIVARIAAHPAEAEHWRAEAYETLLCQCQRASADRAVCSVHHSTPIYESAWEALRKRGAIRDSDG